MSQTKIIAANGKEVCPRCGMETTSHICGQYGSSDLFRCDECHKVFAKPHKVYR